MTNDPRSPLFDLISDTARQADDAYRMTHRHTHKWEQREPTSAMCGTWVDPMCRHSCKNPATHFLVGDRFGGKCAEHFAAMQQATVAVVAGNTATPRKATEHEYARAKAAAAIVKLARVWAGYIGTVAEGSASYCADANHLSDAVAHYEMLCAKDES